MPIKIHNYTRAAAITFLTLPLGLRAESLYRRMPELSVRPQNRNLPSLSILIPARNESFNLKRLIPSLVSCIYPGDLEIIVIDDSSSDGSGAIARSYDLKVIRLNSLAAGCLGKPNACHQGALAARGDWLLFTDADTTHNPHGPASAVAYAVEHQLDGLSLFIKQECKNSTDRLALMTAFAGLYAGRNPSDAALNGQYILIKRDVYRASGGFLAVCNQQMEDLSLGQHLKKSGYRIPMMIGEKAASVYMYDNTRHAWQGMTRLGSGTVKWSGVWSIMTIIFITAMMSPLVVLSGVLAGELRPRWLPITWITVSVSMLPWAKRYGSWKNAFLAPFGALFVQIAAVTGILNRLLGRKNTWKGRSV